MAFDEEVQELEAWFDSPRYRGITRVHTAREVVEQRGTIRADHTVAREAAERFHARLRTLFAQGEGITTFGPYSPGQAVAMKRMGIEAIYLGGWATSAKGSVTEDPGPDLASYPLSQVPDEAAPIVRALLTADKNQAHARARMTDAERRAAPEVDYRPYIIADADTGHGGDAHVRNLVRRFVEVGVPGYHIEDQKPGVKKCGHQGGKVLVAQDEQLKRLVAARFQLDTMGVPGIIVARTDAESATLLDGRGDDRDQPFIFGATDPRIPSFRAAYLAILRRMRRDGLAGLSGHDLYALCDEEYASADAWLARSDLEGEIASAVTAWRTGKQSVDGAFDHVFDRFSHAWRTAAGVMTYADAVAAAIDARAAEGDPVAITREAWTDFAARAPWYKARERARALGLNVTWDCEQVKTPDGYYQIRGGLDLAIARSLAAAPFADLLWMETKSADLGEARKFAEAIHSVFPDKMLAYNLSPSFNWDTTGMNDDEMRTFPLELGKMGFVFNFITYGGHQIDGLAAEEFAASLRENGMLALARVQRQFRLLESGYRTPQTLVGGPRADAALLSIAGRTSTTKAMGEGSTQKQHLVQTEASPKLLAGWVDRWRAQHQVPDTFTVTLRPHTAGSELLELAVHGTGGEKTANVVFAAIRDRRGRSILSVRDQNNFKVALRSKRLLTLLLLFLLHRYKASSVHFVTPTDDNRRQAEGMRSFGIFSVVQVEIGEIIVAEVDPARIAALVATDGPELGALIASGHSDIHRAQDRRREEGLARPPRPATLSRSSI
jgi:isocitrate/methylisocitrate lyase